jgi:putative MATE family efflux protein
MPEANSAEKRQDAAIFTEGSTARHVLVMSMTGAIGTMALFFVDLTDLYFLSLLGETEVTAAVGYALSILLFELSVALGVGTAAGALVSRSLGAGDKERSRDYAASSFLFAILSSTVIVLVIALLSDGLLSLMGAAGETKHLATLFIWTISPGYVLAAGSYCLASILRGLGDARRAMYVTLSTAVITLALDPVFIFVLGWGIQGAAIATVLANAFSLVVGLHGVTRVHNALSPVRWSGLVRDKADIWTIAYPATLSHLMLPLANAYITYVMARFGDEAVAGFAIICRLAPVAFGAIFALSSAVGPIIGQNFGAGRHDRVRTTLTHSLVLCSLYVLSMALLLLVLSDRIATSFKTVGVSYDLVTFFCTYIGVSWAFSGAQFVAGATFNNLGHPRFSALFSWGRVTLGTIPFVWLGAMWGGPEGVLIGNAIGVCLFGSAAVAVAYRLTALQSKMPGQLA